MKKKEITSEEREKKNSKKNIPNVVYYRVLFLCVYKYFPHTFPTRSASAASFCLVSHAVRSFFVWCECEDRNRERIDSFDEANVSNCSLMRFNPRDVIKYQIVHTNQFSANVRLFDGTICTAISVFNII